MLALHEGYLACCDERRFHELGGFVSEDVSGSGPVDGPAARVEGVRDVCTAFPDHRWEVQEVFVEGDVGAGTVATAGSSTAGGDLFPVVRDALTSR